LSWGQRAVEDVVTDKLASADADLSGRLREIEAEYEAEGTKAIRDGLLQAVFEYRRSHYRLGRALFEYKAKTVFKKGLGWTRVVQLIATSLGCDGRSVFRWMEEYARVAELPEATITALENASVDPAARKNADLVDRVAKLTSPDPAEDEAEAAVAQAKVEMQASRPRRLGPAPKAKTRIDQSFAYLEKLYADVDPATREAELKTLLERLFTHFSIEAD
jgi:hypothetical protein